MKINADEALETEEFDHKILSKLDNLQLSVWHVFVAIALGLVWFFDGYEVTLISLYRHQIQDQYSEQVFKSLVSAYQFGGIAGSLFFGPLAFVIGRKKIFIITLVVYFFGVLLSGVQTSAGVFIFSRFLTGLSVGGQFTAIFTAVDQFLPPKYRGRVNIGIDGTWHLGGTLASILTMLVGQTEHWRLMFLVGWVGIVSLMLMRRNVPESPRWLITKNRQTEAGQIIQAIVEAANNNGVLLPQIPSQPPPIILPNQQEKSFCDYFQEIILLLKQAMTLHTKKFIVSFTLIFSQAFFFNLVYYQFPEVLATKFKLDQEEISMYMLPLTITCFISTIVVGPYFDKIGRKVLLLLTYCFSGVLLVCSKQIDTLLFYELTMVLLFVFASPASSSANLISSEVFPTSSRTIVLFVMFCFSMLGGMCGVWVDNYIIAAVLMFCAGVLAFIYCPNSQNKTLQQIQKM